MVSAVQAGITMTYSANKSLPLHRYLREFENQLVLQPLIRTIKESCLWVIRSSIPVEETVRWWGDKWRICLAEVEKLINPVDAPSLTAPKDEM